MATVILLLSLSTLLLVAILDSFLSKFLGCAADDIVASHAIPSLRVVGDPEEPLSGSAQGDNPYLLHCSFYIEQARPVVGKTIHSMSTTSLGQCLEQCRMFGSSCGGANYLLDVRGKPLCLLVDATAVQARTSTATTTTIGRAPHQVSINQEDGQAKDFISQQLNDSAVIYSARRWCGGGRDGLHSYHRQQQHPHDYRNPAESPSSRQHPQLNCVNRPVWLFEKLPSINLIDALSSPYLISSRIGAPLDSCLEQCVKAKSPPCYAVAHSPARSECRLLRISPQRVSAVESYFTTGDPEWDLYEANCERVRRSTQQCAFLRTQHRHTRGLTSGAFDAVLEDVSSMHDCEENCRVGKYSSSGEVAAGEMSAPCRSYEYELGSRTCYLSHRASIVHVEGLVKGNSSVTLKRKQSYKQFDVGELTDCPQFSLECGANSLMLTGRTVKMMSGWSVHSLVRGLATDSRERVACERRIPDGYHFRVEIPFDECGLEHEAKPVPSYTGVLLVKEGGESFVDPTTSLNHPDRLVRVNCRQHQPVSKVDVSTSQPTTPTIFSTATTPVFSSTSWAVGSKTNTSTTTTATSTTTTPLNKRRRAFGAPRFELEQDNFTRAAPLFPTTTQKQPSPITLSPSPNTLALPNIRPVLPTAAAAFAYPSYKLEVLDAGGRLADTVDASDEGYLQITAQLPAASVDAAAQQNAYDIQGKRYEKQQQDPSSDHAVGGGQPLPENFFISELVAENLLDDQYIELIDAQGCVSNSGVVKSLEKMSPNQMRIGVLFGGFGVNPAKVTYQALVRPCAGNCMPDCNRVLYTEAGRESAAAAQVDEGSFEQKRVTLPADSMRQSRLRSKRSISSQREAKLTEQRGVVEEEYDLQGDVYWVRSSSVPFTTTIKTNSSTVSSEELPSRLHRCLYDGDGNCIVTLMAMAVQLMLVALCIYMFYLCLQKPCEKRDPTEEWETITKCTILHQDSPYQ